MIAGHITLEGQSLHFQHDGEGQVRYTICDGLTGQTETVNTHSEAFAYALGIALHPDGEATQEQFDIAEGAMPLNPALRWIP